MSINKLDDILAKIQKYHPKYIDLDLQRINRILEDLGNPHHSLPPTIHIAGTNGKGSTVSFLRSMLKESGLIVHSYTSPHLVKFNERIRIKDKIISNNFLLEVLSETDKINNNQEITFFEFTTAAAFLAFSKIKADILLLEVGLGGRLDATNVVPKIIASIITEISFDHEHFLGSTLKEISKEKCGIIKKNKPVITISQKPEIIGTIKEKCLKQNSPLFVIEKKKFKLSSNLFSFYFNNTRINLPIPNLKGKHQLENCALSTICLKIISKKIKNLNFKKSLKGIKNANWPARSQFIKTGKLVKKIDKKFLIILDGAHNVSGAKALNNVLLSVGKKWQLIFGFLKTRDPLEFLNELNCVTEKIITTEIAGQSNSFSSSELYKIIKNEGYEGEKSDSLYDAIEIASKNKLDICICGSLYLAGEFLKINQTTPS